MIVPVISAGSRSGVNWMRWNVAWMVCERVLTSSVLASPGTPSIRQCPPVNRPISTRSTISRWPATPRDTARHLIAGPAMLEHRTRGNLDEPEQKLLASLIYDLRVAYVDAQKAASG